MPTAAKFGAFCAAAAAAQAAAPALLGGGGGGPGFGGWGGGGGGGGFFNFWQLGAARAEEAEEEDEEEVEYEEVTDDEAEEGQEYEVEEPDDAEGLQAGEEVDSEDDDDEDNDLPDPAAGANFFCHDIVATGLPEGKGIPTQEDLFAGLKCQPGFVCSRADLSEDLRNLYQMGIFNKVDGRVVPGKNRKCKLYFDFKQTVYPEIKSFDVKGASLIPREVVERVMKEKEPGPTTMKTLAQIKNIVEGWYQERGYAYSYVMGFEGLDSGNAVATMVEGKVKSVSVLHMDENGQPTKDDGEIKPDVILRELSIKPGQIYNLEDGRKALRDVFALQLFDNVQVLPRQQQNDESKIDVEVMVKERPMQTAEVEGEWSIAPGDSGKPGLVSLVPGGTLTYEHRNLNKTGQQINASVNAPNLLAPGEDLGFRVDFKQPYVFGSSDPKKTSLILSAFNARKISGVFIPGPSGEEVPPIFIDRTGLKVAVQEQYTRNSKGSLGLVVEQVQALDEAGGRCPRGSKVIQTAQGGMLDPDGPPVTLSDSGVDRLAFLQASVTRDATYYDNGTPIGPRDILQVEQGLGLGTGMAFFNRHVLSMTRFLKLRNSPAGSTAPPPVLVLHGRYGNAVGSLASYDAFTLGGPYSVRGFNVGELATCRTFAELATELRLPVHGRQVFAFIEHGTDLSSSKLVRGNPTAYYRRAGSGTSVGLGIKLGAVRAEYATEGTNLRENGSLYLRFGERY